MVTGRGFAGDGAVFPDGDPFEHRLDGRGFACGVSDGDDGAGSLPRRVEFDGDGGDGEGVRGQAAVTLRRTASRRSILCSGK